jgi:hypothetical protein
MSWTPDEVHREYRRRPADNPVDYALLLSRTPRLFIEAKGLGENIDDPKWANQAAEACQRAAPLADVRPAA